MKFRQHVAAAALRAALTLTLVSFVTAFLFSYLWQPGFAYLLGD